MSVKCPKCQVEILDDSQFCSKCGTPIHPGDKVFLSHTRTILRPIDEMVPGKILADKYKIDEVAGKGGMGIVYKAEDTKLKRNVALKFLPPELMQDEEAKERFVLEAQAAAALSHPNICTIHEINEANGRSFIAMEYVKGQSLRAKIDKGPLEEQEALDIAIQLTEGLDEAHKKGIIHRDIKSANVMVTEKGQAKIMDFGLAKVKGGTLLTREGTTLGTVAYMSPEQARGEDVDQRTDIWSVGIVMYEMLSGQLPFVGDREASILYSVVHEESKSLKTFNPDISQKLLHIVGRALSKKPSDRFQSATELLKELGKYQELLKIKDPVIRRPMVAIPSLLLVAAICLALIWFLTRQAKVRWARNTAIPEIVNLISEDDQSAAYALAEKTEKYIPTDPTLVSLWPQLSTSITIETQPPDAAIYEKNYLEVEEEWRFLGNSPIKDIRISSGFKRWKIEKEGYETLRLAFEPNSLFTFPELKQLKLCEKGPIPDGMVQVPNLTIPKMVQGMMMSGVDPIGDIQLESFLIDRFETTNQQYKEFLDSGGYQKREYWKHAFIKDGRELSWDEAMLEFRDATGRPGPVEWAMGTYPDGEDDYPVRGISWYEASAYAEFAGKSLPTIYHWYCAAGTFESAGITSLSNFGNDGPAIVGSHSALNTFGSHDMAGNVREWCWNESRGLRYILGGAWNDQIYLFFHPLAQSPFDRSPSNGFRCIRYLDPEDSRQAITHPVELAVRDYYQETPVDDSFFRAYKQQFSYDPSELNALVGRTDDIPEYWTEEKITFDAAYDGDRVVAYLFLPKAASPPYQTIIIFPGSSAIRTDSSRSWFNRIKWIMQSGRAVVFPIYKGTYERRDGLASTWPNRSHRYTDYVTKWIKDLRRSIDYLETRSEIDIGRLAYLGISWGGRMGAIIPAVEPRIKASILWLGGLASGRALAEVDQINYITRVTCPVLMLNGRYDSIEPVETAQKPMYKLLGTPEEHKRLVIYETDHGLPRNAAIRDSLEWLDRYLGPVKK